MLIQPILFSTLDIFKKNSLNKNSVQKLKSLVPSAGHLNYRLNVVLDNLKNSFFNCSNFKKYPIISEVNFWITKMFRKYIELYINIL